MEEFLLQPGKALGPFALGAHMSDIMALVADSLHRFGPGLVRFHEQAPFKLPLRLSLAKIGLDLLFNPVSQRLERLALVSLSSLQVAYETLNGPALVCTPQHPSSFLAVHTLLGPSESGEYLGPLTKDHYVLRYPGLACVFDVPQDLRALPYPDSALVTLRSIFVYMPDPERPELLCHIGLPSGRPLIEAHPFGLSFPALKRSLRFGAAPQDALSILGAGVWSAKQEDALAIHSGVRANAFQRDLFLAYPSLGLELLFDGGSKALRKIVLHHNAPTHPSFGLRRACPYVLFHPRPPRPDAEVGPTHTWPEVRAALGPDHTAPFRLPAPEAHPFGGATFYAYSGLLFEVLHNNHIAAVTLFRA